MQARKGMLRIKGENKDLIAHFVTNAPYYLEEKINKIFNYDNICHNYLI